MGKRALITGVLGQDGSYLSDLLLSKGYTVYGMVRRNSAPTYERVQHLLANDRFILVPGDLADQVALNNIVKDCQPDEVYNLAAQSQVGLSFSQPIFTSDISGLGVLRVLEAIKAHKPDARFYQASSSEMFGKVRETPQTEKTPFYPRSPYGVAKVYGHHITVNYRESYGMFACSGILFNHESVPKHTPVLIKRDGLIDILPIEDMFKSESHRYEGLRDKYNGAVVWDGECWTEILGGTAYKDVEKPIRCVQAPHGCYEATYDHVAFMDGNIEKETKNIKIGDKLQAVKYPDPIQKMRHDLEVARVIGYIVGDGYISESGDIRLTGLDKEELKRYANILVDHFGWFYRVNTYGPGGYEGSDKDVWQVDFNGGCRPWGKWLREHIYTCFSHQKRVPQFILNANAAVKQAFFEGYYDADGRKRGNEQYHLKGWTSESAALCLGLIVLVRELTEQTIKVGLQYRDGRRYYYCNLRSPDTNGHKGQHLCKDLYEITKLFDVQSDGWFYDLTTNTKRFAVGPNLIQIHNSPRRGIEFVTRKITDGVARVKCGITDKIGFGTMTTKRDWGHAEDYCVNLDVPILTTKGWKLYDEVSEGDQIINFDPRQNRLSVDIVKRKILKDSNGEKILLKGRGVHLCVTPQHRIYYQQKYSYQRGWTPEWKVTTAGDFYNKLHNKAKRTKYDYRLPHFRGYEGKGIEIRDDQLYLMGVLLTEGHLNHSQAPGKGISVSLSQSEIPNPKTFQKIIETMDRLGLEYRTINKQNGVTEWVLSANSSRVVWSWFDSNDIHNMPEYIWGASKRQMEILFTALMDCDGHWGSLTYVSKRYKLAVDFQTIAHLTGRRTTEVKNHNDCYRVTCISQRHPYMYVQDFEKLNDSHTQVWCVETENGTIITRDSDSINISGNCRAMWLMLQQDEPDDYVIATGETHSVQEFMESAFNSVGLKYEDHVYTDPRYIRPAEVDYLRGDASKAKEKLGWEPKISFQQLVERMVDSDLERYRKGRE